MVHTKQEKRRLEVLCPICINCGLRGIVKVPGYALTELENGAMIQDAWPDSKPHEREMLMNGIHPHCWREMFGDGE